MQRPIHVVIPFKLDGAKSRLALVLSPEERRQLALAMLRDVLDAVSGLDQVTLLARPSRGNNGLDIEGDYDILECGLELNDALNSLIQDWQKRGWPEDMLIVMADLALLTPEDLEGIIRTEGDVVLSPGRGGGTNMILIRNSKFRTCYQGVSFTKHLDFCRNLGLEAKIYANYRAGCDIDEPMDLAEILIHNKGQARITLKRLGLTLSEESRGGYIRESKIG